MDKSYVSMEQHQCPICLAMFETGNILMDNRLRDRFKRHTLTGHSPCAECQERLDQGYIAMVETQDAKDAEKISLDVPRSGNLMFIKREAFAAVFNVPPPGDDKPPMVFVEPGVMAQLQAMIEGSNQVHH